MLCRAPRAILRPFLSSTLNTALKGCMELFPAGQAECTVPLQWCKTQIMLVAMLRVAHHPLVRVKGTQARRDIQRRTQGGKPGMS